MRYEPGEVGGVALVVRLEGTNVERGKKLLAESGLKIIAANNLGDAAEKAVTAAQGSVAASTSDKCSGTATTPAAGPATRGGGDVVCTTGGIR